MPEYKEYCILAEELNIKVLRDFSNARFSSAKAEWRI